MKCGYIPHLAMNAVFMSLLSMKRNYQQTDSCSYDRIAELVSVLTSASETLYITPFLKEEKHKGIKMI